jgi:hypothetical protein
MLTTALSFVTYAGYFASDFSERFRLRNSRHSQAKRGVENPPQLVGASRAGGVAGGRKPVSSPIARLASFLRGSLLKLARLGLKNRAATV